MIENRKLTGDIIKEISQFTQGVQVIQGVDLYKIPKENLKFPRMIIDLINYNDSDYDYVDYFDKYNPKTDKVEMQCEKIPKITYRFRIYNDSKNNIDIWKIIYNIHKYYSNPYQTKLKGEMQVLQTDVIHDVSSGVDYDYTLGYQFTMDFNMSDIYNMEHDYADTLGVQLKVNYENHQDIHNFDIKRK